MRILILAHKDLTQMLRDKRVLIFLVAMPVLFTLFMGIAYQGGEEAEADPRLQLAVVDPDPEAPMNTLLADQLAASNVLEPAPMQEAAALESLQKGEIAGVLVIPTDFSKMAMAGEAVQIKLIAESGSLEGQSLYQLLRVPVSQLMSSAEISQSTVKVIAPDDPAKEGVAAFDLAWRNWEAAAQIDLVRVELAVGGESDDWTGGNPYNMASPGILVQFAIIGLITSAQVLVLERQTRTLQRMRTTTMRPWEIIAGHTLAMFALVVLQTLLLIVFGQWILKVNYLQAPLGTLLISVALGFWVAAMGLLIGVLAKEEQQVILFSMMAMFVFSALGGTWFPLEASGDTFAAIGRWTPAYWAMTGYQNILIRGLGSSSTYMSVLVLLGYAMGFFVLAVWIFRKKEI